MASTARFLAVLVIAVLGTGIAVPASGAGADSRVTVQTALSAYERELAPARAAAINLDEASELAESRRMQLRQSELILDDADRELNADRSRFAGIVVSAYMGIGARTSEVVTEAEQGLPLLTGRLRTSSRIHSDARKAVERAKDDLEKAERRVERDRRELVQAESQLQASAEELDNVIRPLAPTLPGVAYGAYVLASRVLTAENPECTVPPALLVGLGRIMSNHGASGGVEVTSSGRTTTRLLDRVAGSAIDTDNGLVDGSTDRDMRVGPMQLLPSQWNIHSATSDATPRSPDWLLSSSLVAGRFLCSVVEDLSTDTGLHKALVALSGNPSLARAILGASRHASRAHDLSLGTLPTDPRLEQAMAFRDRNSSTVDVTGSIEELVKWSRERLGTPYSQCLGADIRPEDPECPPGTNRFGIGFFDCSGYVSAAFAAIGFDIPRTTDAMILSDDFARYAVADSYSDATDRAGDILLMDGHVAISIGNGSIIHASGGELREETMPEWVRNGILGVYRIALS